jgi:hypothetical protein
MTPEHLALYRQLSETKIYRERFVGLRNKHYGDKAFFPEIDDIQTVDFYVEHDNFIWIPPVFDIISPMRCLWGMVDWQLGGMRLYPNIDNKVEIIEAHYNWYDRLDIALIKAILKQEEKL